MTPTNIGSILGVTIFPDAILPSSNMPKIFIPKDQAMKNNQRAMQLVERQTAITAIFSANPQFLDNPPDKYCYVPDSSPMSDSSGSVDSQSDSQATQHAPMLHCSRLDSGYESPESVNELNKSFQSSEPDQSSLSRKTSHAVSGTGQESNNPSQRLDSNPRDYALGPRHRAQSLQGSPISGEDHASGAHIQSKPIARSQSIGHNFKPEHQSSDADDVQPIHAEQDQPGDTLNELTSIAPKINAIKRKGSAGLQKLRGTGKVKDMINKINNPHQQR